jgi:uncharacterized protein YyaL (SSP411 family)
MGKGVIESLKEMSAGAVRALFLLDSSLIRRKKQSSSRTPASLAQILSTKPSLKVWSNLLKTHDPRYGGFSPKGPRSEGPKFPSCSMTLQPLARFASYPPAEGDEDIREEARSIGVKMIRAIWEGGIHDWVGGGVARYSVDEKWMVPHFEKML